MRYLSTFILALLSILFFASCSTNPDTESDRGTVTFGFGTDDKIENHAALVGALDCSATPSANSVSPGQSFTVQIVISSGQAPYSAPGFVPESSSPSFSVSGRYNFSYNRSTVIDSYIRVTATEGGATVTGYCPFSITLLP